MGNTAAASAARALSTVQPHTGGEHCATSPSAAETVPDKIMAKSSVMSISKVCFFIFSPPLCSIHNYNYYEILFACYYIIKYAH